jgi:hypothetical protein
MHLAVHVSVLELTLWIVGAVVVLAIVAGLLGRAFLKRGMREPFILRAINRASDQFIDAIKRPVTIAVLDEVFEVLRTGHYTRNIAAALAENRQELKKMVAEKIKEDAVTRRITLVPFHDWIIDQASETTLRVIFEVLDDPRTDELISDLLRDNIDQIRQAVREQEEAKPVTPPDEPGPEQTEEAKPVSPPSQTSSERT